MMKIYSGGAIRFIRLQDQSGRWSSLQDEDDRDPVLLRNNSYSLGEVRNPCAVTGAEFRQVADEPVFQRADAIFEPARAERDASTGDTHALVSVGTWASVKALDLMMSMSRSAASDGPVCIALAHAICCAAV